MLIGRRIQHANDVWNLNCLQVLELMLKDCQLIYSAFGPLTLHLPNPVGTHLLILYRSPRYTIPQDQEVKLQIQIHTVGVPRHGRIRVRQL